MDAEADLWRFALSVYGTHGVADDCLALQEQYGADIPVVLCALWMARRGTALDRAAMDRLVGAVDPWHREVVKPLRAVRQRMKHGPTPAPSPKTEALRETLKGVELNAEKIEMAILAAVVAEHMPAGDPVDVGANLRAALAQYADGPIEADAPLARLIAASEAASAT